MTDIHLREKSTRTVFHMALLLILISQNLCANRVSRMCRRAQKINDRNFVK